MSSGKEKTKEEIIQFVGVSSLAPSEQEVVQILTTEYFDKIKRAVHNMTNLTVHVKAHNAEGNRKKYSLHVRVQVPTKNTFESCNADDWELPRAVHKAFEDVQSQIRHKLHTDITRPR
ncbi:hypothetical protein HY489_04925 [Candidatus Woesearchaeota archaeon]|nr:hypothetical protein [Candidatus Woesearchaeota archaeon]